MTAALLASLAVGSIASLVLAALWQGAQKICLQERAAHVQQLAEMEARYTTGLQLSEAARVDEVARLEALIEQKKADIATLEADQYACNSPALVRERLRKLLLSPTSTANSAGAGTGPLGTMPFGSTSNP